MAWKFGSGTWVWFTSVAWRIVCHHCLASTGFHALKICAARWNFENVCCLSLSVALIILVAAVPVVVLNLGAYILPCRVASCRPVRFRLPKLRGERKKKKWTLLYLFAHSRGHCRPTLACCPTTAPSAQFCLLCCQPEPLPESLAARAAPLTQGRPCRLGAW